MSNHVTVTTGRFPFKVVKTVFRTRTGTATYVVFGFPLVKLSYEFDRGEDIVEFLGRTSK